MPKLDYLFFDTPRITHLKISIAKPVAGTNYYLVAWLAEQD
jgi:hypothetical protein